MATLTKELTLTQTWQLVTATGFMAERTNNNNIELCNANALPSGDQPSHTIKTIPNINVPKPLNGSWYARVPVVGDQPTVLTITEV